MCNSVNENGCSPCKLTNNEIEIYIIYMPQALACTWDAALIQQDTLFGFAVSGNFNQC